MDLEADEPLRIGEFGKLQRCHSAETHVEMKGIGVRKQWRVARPLRQPGAGRAGKGGYFRAPVRRRQIVKRRFGQRAGSFTGDFKAEGTSGGKHQKIAMRQADLYGGADRGRRPVGLVERIERNELARDRHFDADH